MSFYNDNKELFLEPKTTQYGGHMVMTNVKKETKTKYINIDTRFRDDYNYSDPVNYNLTLPERITDVKSIKVKNVELPIVYYNVSAKNGNNSDTLPVRILTTPPGKSELLSTSANVTAQSGFVSDASITHVFPPAIMGAIIETNPINEVP